MEEKGNLELIYNRILEKLQASINPFTYNGYIKDLKPLRIYNRTIILQSSTNTFATYITTTLTEKIKKAISDADVGLDNFEIYVAQTGEHFLFDENEDVEQGSPLNPSFTFDNFIVDDSNKLLYAAAREIATNPGVTEIYNPLFIYGGTGLGKTHLSQAIAAYVKGKKPNLKVMYVTSEKFFSEIINSMLGNKSSEKREQNTSQRLKYRECDLLIIDDIQFIAGKSAVQQELFHIFNELVTANKQIVLTSDIHPKKLENLEERLITRFSGGLIFNILPPNFQTKIEILKKKAWNQGCQLSDDVASYLAQDSDDDVRTIEGRLKKVIFASRLQETAITIDFARKALALAADTPTEKGELTPDIILNICATYYHTDVESICARTKKKEIAHIRHVTCYLMCEKLAIPLSAIGKALGGRDHTTIMNSRDKVIEMLRTRTKLRNEIDDLKAIIDKQ